MKLLLLLLLATQAAPAAKPREIVVTKIERGPTFYDPGQNTARPAAGTVANDYKTGYFVLAKTTTSPVIHYKLACPWAPVEVGGTYFIKQSSSPGEVRRAVFTDKDGKPSDMLCFVDLEMRAGEPDVSTKGTSR